MENKLYIYNNTATFICPDCGRYKTVDVSRFIDADKAVKVRSRCKCGYRGSAFLERRSYQRQEITLPGMYSRELPGGRVEKGPIVVMDLSCSGAKIKPHFQSNFTIGDKIKIKFNLNDSKKSLVKKEAMVISMDIDCQMGMAFSTIDTKGPIGPYLFG